MNESPPAGEKKLAHLSLIDAILRSTVANVLSRAARRTAAVPTSRRSGKARRALRTKRRRIRVARRKQRRKK